MLDTVVSTWLNYSMVAIERSLGIVPFTVLVMIGFTVYAIGHRVMVRRSRMRHPTAFRERRYLETSYPSQFYDQDDPCSQ